MLKNLINNDFYFYLNCIDELDKNFVKIKEISNLDYAGLFEPTNLLLEINSSYDDMTETFVHEYCHFEQWKEKCEVWENCSINGVDASLILENFLESQDEKNIISIIDACKKIADLELDCEKRVVEKIKKYNLKINISDYIKKSNAYICCYYLIPEFKCWMKNRPYTIKDKLPDKFDINHNMWANVLYSDYKEIFLS